MSDGHETRVEKVCDSLTATCGSIEISWQSQSGDYMGFYGENVVNQLPDDFHINFITESP